MSRDDKMQPKTVVLGLCLNLFDIFYLIDTVWYNKKQYIGVPTGIRTPVASVKGRCPRPLDDGDLGI